LNPPEIFGIEKESAILSNFHFGLSKPFASEILQGVNETSLVTKGLAIALMILGLWVVSFFGLLSVNLNDVPLHLIAIAVLWQMFLTTGLFITAHDAMHGSIEPKNPKANAIVGTVAVFIYGMFSYRQLLQKHWQHHHFPASDRDPDFHNGIHTNPVAWYVHFMKNYWGWRQLIGFTIFYYFAKDILHIHFINLVLFWIVPLILSSLQLFYFGTFLPHHRPVQGYTNSHRAQTSSLPVFWSFITCYHFGYHEEHHEYPDVPWWQLPTVYRARQLN